MSQADEAVASSAQPSPAPTASMAADLEEIVMPTNFTDNPKEIHTARRHVQRIEAVVGEKPWEWLAEFPPKQ
jgi:hypothetical protein